MHYLTYYPWECFDRYFQSALNFLIYLKIQNEKFKRRDVEGRLFVYKSYLKDKVGRDVYIAL